MHPMDCLHRLLDRANDKVMDRVKALLQGQYAILTADGWKDESRNAVNGVNLSVNGKLRSCLYNGTLKTYNLPIKTYLVDLILTNSHKKDGLSMCEAFNRLSDLKDPMRQAVISGRHHFCPSWCGEKSKKKMKLWDDAISHCDLIDDRDFWHRLKTVIDDLEPICLGTNMNQSDAMRPDQALLTFAGIFLHFSKHSKPAVAAGMSKRIEKH